MKHTVEGCVAKDWLCAAFVLLCAVTAAVVEHMLYVV